MALMVFCHYSMLLQQSLCSNRRWKDSRDVIAAIVDGKIAESGSHQSLLAKRGIYFNLVSAQVSILLYGLWLWLGCGNNTRASFL